MFGGLFFYIVGIYAFILWFIDNFKSSFQILWHVLMSYLQPHMYPGLSEQFGNWAVVTGSTDGIGREYAKELAQRGINIVLIARNESKLIDVSKEIESSYAVQTKYIVADFSCGKDTYDRIASQLEDLSNPIDILVNNVGIFYDYPEEMAKVSSDTVWNLVMTNVASMTMMTHMLIDKMKQRKKGVIVNISSACSITPCGYGCLYAATKSFAQSLTWGIQRECAPYGINVQLLSPYVVSTKILHYPKTTNIFVPNVVSYCRWAIFTLLKTNETTGYWSHAIQLAFMKMLPYTLRSMIMETAARYFHNEYFVQTSQCCTTDCRLCYKKTIRGDEKSKPE